jgi:hypothetical protein
MKRRKPPVFDPRSLWRPISEAPDPPPGRHKPQSALVSPGPANRHKALAYKDGDDWFTDDSDHLIVKPKWFMIVPPTPDD